MVSMIFEMCVCACVLCCVGYPLVCGGAGGVLVGETISYNYLLIRLLTNYISYTRN
jgi:hypothetical protein